MRDPLYEEAKRAIEEVHTLRTRLAAVEAERDGLRIAVEECQVVLDRQRVELREALDRAQVAEAERDRLADGEVRRWYLVAEAEQLRRSEAFLKREAAAARDRADDARRATAEEIAAWLETHGDERGTRIADRIRAKWCGKEGK